MSNIPILSWIIFLPMIGLIPILILDSRYNSAIRWIALVFAVLNFALSLFLVANFDSTTPKMQFVENFRWIEAIKANYHVGVDGISILLVLLTTFMSVMAIAATWSSITEKVKGFMASFLILETGMLGVFLSLDLFLFYIFWEVMLLPMYFIIGIWGGKRRIYEAIKFMLFTMAGSLLMLLAIIYLYYMHYRIAGVGSFDLNLLMSMPIAHSTQLWLFGAFALAFAIKVPMFPFHTWLPDAHVEAPTAGSIILAAVLLKMGTYGFLRFCLPLFPDAVFQLMPLIAILALIGIIYGGLVSAVQNDIKSLVAFSSVAHMGFVMLGIFALNTQGISGSLIQMINHGVSTGALFLLVGMIYERRHTRLIEDFGGLAHVMPWYAVGFMIVALSSIGLPGTNGFVGEFLILLGMFKTNMTFAIIGTSGIIIAAVYMLWMIQRVFFGECAKDENRSLSDINWRERWILIPLIVMIFWIGIYPKPFLKMIEPSVDNLINTVQFKHANPIMQTEIINPNNTQVQIIETGESAR